MRNVGDKKRHDSHQRNNCLLVDPNQTVMIDHVQGDEEIQFDLIDHSE